MSICPVCMLISTISSDEFSIISHRGEAIVLRGVTLAIGRDLILALGLAPVWLSDKSYIRSCRFLKGHANGSAVDYGEANR